MVSAISIICTRLRVLLLSIFSSIQNFPFSISLESVNFPFRWNSLSYWFTAFLPLWAQCVVRGLAPVLSTRIGQNQITIVHSLVRNTQNSGSASLEKIEEKRRYLHSNIGLCLSTANRVQGKSLIIVRNYTRLTKAKRSKFFRGKSIPLFGLIFLD